MKVIRNFLTSLFITIQCFSQIQFDTVTSYTIGPGVIYSKLNNSLTPWSVNIIKIDLKNPLIALESAKGRDTLYGGQEKTSSMSQRKNVNGHFVVGAINADFFNYTPAGVPTNMQIVNGEVLKRESANPTIGITSDKKIYFGKASYFGLVIAKDKSKDTINSLNEARLTDNLIIYNSLFGRATYTNNFGTEVIVRPINEWFINDTVICVVDSIRNNLGNTLIPKGKMVLSGHGSSNDFLSTKISKGDTIKVYQRISTGIKKIKELLGGHPIIVDKDSLANLDFSDPFLTARHPRSLVGINKDTSIMYLVTVDGRQSTSLGMNVYEMYDLMAKNLKCYYAMNFDGGGSTSLVVRNQIMNFPSDAGGERSVGNALLVISNTTQGPLTVLQMSPKTKKVYYGEKVQLSATGWDQYYNPVSISPSFIQYSCKPQLGNINSVGLFTAATQPDSGYIIVSYQGVKDSCWIIIKPMVRLDLIPKNTITDYFHYVNYKVKAIDNEGVEIPVPYQNIKWKVLDTIIGKIDLMGQFKGNLVGNTLVVGSVFSMSDTGSIEVQLVSGEKIMDSMETLGSWFLTGEWIDSLNTKLILTDSVHSLGNFSFKIDYRFVYDSTKINYLYLNYNQKLPGLPDTISIDFMSDGQGHRVFFDVEDNTGVQQRIFNFNLANQAGIFVPMMAKSYQPSSFIYPMRLRRIAIPLGSSKIVGQTYSGTIYLDNLKLRFPNYTTSVDENEIPYKDFNLSQNYPNPFNPSTRIDFVVGKRSLVYIKVYDILGNLISTPINKVMESGKYTIEFNGENHSTGVYFYMLQIGDKTLVKKMVLLK